MLHHVVQPGNNAIAIIIHHCIKLNIVHGAHAEARTCKCDFDATETPQWRRRSNKLSRRFDKAIVQHLAFACKNVVAETL